MTRLPRGSFQSAVASRTRTTQLPSATGTPGPSGAVQLDRALERRGGGERPLTCYCLRMHADIEGGGPLPVEQAELAAEVFRMLADTTRVRLLWAMLDADVSVNELAVMVGKSGPSVSQHLAKLRMARLVRTRREGTQVFYRIENEHVARLVRDAVFNAEHAGPDVPRHHQDATPLRPARRGGTK